MSHQPAPSGATQKIWRDGELVDFKDANIHVMSHVVHYGSSVFEGIRCYETPSGGAVFRLREHMRRLQDSAKIYRMDLKYSLDELCQAVVDTIAANGLKECYIRPLVARTGQNMGVHPGNAPIETFIICWIWGRYLGEEALERGVDVRVSSWRRAAGSTFPTMAKAGGNYLSSQLTKMEAKVDDYIEGVMLDVHGHVSEGSGENLFLVRDGALYTSTIGSGILQGITRNSVLRIAQDLGLEVRESPIPREMLYVADEVFFCGTAAELTPVRSIDRITIGEGHRGPVTKAVQDKYLGIAAGRIPDPYGWLTPVPTLAPSSR
ncbi:MAG: branched-chain amino acid transaminase [Gemmatimonadota bacterium]|nr:branched-chain amino acid transaminase [Gemmatimonadota bacterium]